MILNHDFPQGVKRVILNFIPISQNRNSGVVYSGFYAPNVQNPGMLGFENNDPTTCFF